MTMTAAPPATGDTAGAPLPPLITLGYAVSAGTVIVYRLGLPAWRAWRHGLEVSHVVAEGPGLTSVYLRGRRLGRLPVRGWWPPGADPGGGTTYFTCACLGIGSVCRGGRSDR